MKIKFTTVQRMMKRRFIRAEVTVDIFKEDESYIAYAPALEISSYGDTEDEAKQAFEEVVKIFFEETDKKGTLERELLKLGWNLRMKPKPTYVPPTIHNKIIKGKNIKNSYNSRVAIPLA